MTEIDVIRDPRDDSGCVASFVNSATMSFDVTDDLQLDAGANIGLTRTADDLTLFLGVSHRF